MSFKANGTRRLYCPLNLYMLEDMGEGTRIVIADRSELAENIYRLLLSPLGVTLICRHRFEEARPHFFRRESVKLAIFNSNIFGKKFQEIVKSILEDEPLRNVKKIFICKETPAESEWHDRLSKLVNSKIIRRPFHPDEFLALTRRIVD